MPEPREIKPVGVNDDFHICPSCGYARGFHVSFVTMDRHKEIPGTPDSGVYRIILICPECGARYDIGWKTPLAGPAGGHAP